MNRHNNRHAGNPKTNKHFQMRNGGSMKSIMQWLTKPPVDGPRSVLLLRLMVGGVFFWEGVLKFVYVNQGLGRFTKLALPFPAFTADFVGCLEIVGGLLFLSGLLTRLIAIPFIIEMIVAMLSTKISLYLGTSPLPLPAAPPQIGFWAVLHEIRSEYAQIMVALYLLINGPGKWSIDTLLDKLRTSKTQ
ncbi:MAG: DoxX family protein [Actinomycetes bacterium]